MSDDVEAQIVAGAIAALRKRADRQKRIAQEGQIAGERGSVIRSGESSIALRLARTLREVADELDAGAPR
jgi:hypothetical protein